MRYLFTLLILLAIGSSFAQDKTPYADYLKANTTVNDAVITFFITNTSQCNIDSITVRIAHNGVYDSYDKDSLAIRLRPEESGVAALNLSQVPSEGWGWTIDSLETSKSDRASCGYTGTVNFEQIRLGGTQPYPAFTTGAASSSDGTMNYPVTRNNNALAVNTPTTTTAAATVATTPLTGHTPSQVVNTETSPNQVNYYYVVKGDTLYALSKRYNLTVDALKQLNGLASNDLRLGQKLIVPSSNTIAVTPPVPTTATATPIPDSISFHFTLYAVQKGDTIYSIAKNNLTTVPLLMAANCLNSNSVIKVGNILRIPKPGAIVSGQCN